MKDFQQVTFEITRRYLKDRLPCLSKDLGNILLGWCRNKDVARLSKASELFDPASHGVEVMRTLLQVEAFYKKSSAFTVPEIVRASAITNFDIGEKRCRITNRRLDHYYFNPQRLHASEKDSIERMRRYISRVLGPFDEFVRDLPNLIRLTSGAASDSSRRESSPWRKLRRKIPIGSRAAPYLQALSGFYGYKVRSEITETNRIAFVPKSWRTERTIACEPVGNLPLQLAFDRYTKDRLKLFSIDLSSQVRNQELARLGSIDGRYATLDLEGASDSLCISAVAWLLPDDWWEYLNNVRSPFYKLDGQVRRYAKFSSMGNGATFALETLVFAAACSAFTSDFAVYGDDIIVPPDHVKSVVEALRFFGFKLNRQKSHTAGPFRESCGVNCFEGHDITPFYLRQWRKILTDFHHNVNGLVSISAPAGELMSFLATLVEERQDALIVPQNESTISGIFIDTHEAYSRRLIRTKSKQFGQHVPVFTGLVSVSKGKLRPDSKSLFLWFLTKEYQNWKPYSRPNPVERSEEPSAVQKYVRKTVPFRPVHRDVSGSNGRANHSHLYWWAAVLSRSMRSPRSPGSG